MEKDEGREEAEESRKERSGTCGQAMRSTARKGRSIEKKSGAHLMTEDIGVLQRGHP